MWRFHLDLGSLVGVYPMLETAALEMPMGTMDRGNPRRSVVDMLLGTIARGNSHWTVGGSAGLDLPRRDHDLLGLGTPPEIGDFEGILALVELVGASLPNRTWKGIAGLVVRVMERTGCVRIAYSAVILFSKVGCVGRKRETTNLTVSEGRDKANPLLTA